MYLFLSICKNVCEKQHSLKHPIAVYTRANDGAQQLWQKVATRLSGYAAFGGNAVIGVCGFWWQRYCQGTRQKVEMQRKELTRIVLVERHRDVKFIQI